MREAKNIGNKKGFYCRPIEPLAKQAAVHLLIVASKTQDTEQAQEQVIDGYIQANGRHNVVTLTALNNGAGLKQNHR